MDACTNYSLHSFSFISSSLSAYSLVSFFEKKIYLNQQNTVQYSRNKDIRKCSVITKKMREKNQ